MAKCVALGVLVAGLAGVGLLWLVLWVDERNQRSFARSERSHWGEA
jgi:hypothetical protein